MQCSFNEERGSESLLSAHCSVDSSGETSFAVANSREVNFWIQREEVEGQFLKGLQIVAGKGMRCLSGTGSEKSVTSKPSLTVRRILRVNRRNKESAFCLGLMMPRPPSFVGKVAMLQLRMCTACACRHFTFPAS